jgi:hypothetical protein
LVKSMHDTFLDFSSQMKRSKQRTDDSGARWRFPSTTASWMGAANQMTHKDEMVMMMCYGHRYFS